MEDLTTLNLDELDTRYRTTVSDYRYYHSTDDLHSWLSETTQRQATDTCLDALSAEYERRELIPPSIP